MTRNQLSDAIRQHLESIDIEPGRVHHLEIRHDDDCSHWNGHTCDCEPTIASGEPVDRKYGGEEEP